MTHAAATRVTLGRVPLGDVLGVVGLAPVHLVVRLALQLLQSAGGGGEGGRRTVN